MLKRPHNNQLTDIRQMYAAALRWEVEDRDKQHLWTHSPVSIFLCQQLQADQSPLCVMIWRKWCVKESGTSCPPDLGSTCGIIQRNIIKIAILALYRNGKRLWLKDKCRTHMQTHTNTDRQRTHTHLTTWVNLEVKCFICSNSMSRIIPLTFSYI